MSSDRRSMGTKKASKQEGSQPTSSHLLANRLERPFAHVRAANSPTTRRTSRQATSAHQSGIPASQTTQQPAKTRTDMRTTSQDQPARQPTSKPTSTSVPTAVPSPLAHPSSPAAQTPRSMLPPIRSDNRPAFRSLRCTRHHATAATQPARDAHRGMATTIFALPAGCHSLGGVVAEICGSWLPLVPPAPRCARPHPAVGVAPASAGAAVRLDGAASLWPTRRRPGGQQGDAASHTHTHTQHISAYR